MIILTSSSILLADIEAMHRVSVYCRLAFTYERMA